jgi:hypothetical protein
MGYRWKDIFTRPISENLNDHTSAFEKDERDEQEEPEHKERVVTKYAAGVSPWGFCVGIGVFFIVGYMVAWCMHAHSSEAMVYGFFAVLFIWFLRKPMQWWAGYVAEKNKELEQQRKLQEQLGLTDDMPKQPKREPKQKKHAFTSDDFDDKAQAMLTPMVKQARKAKAKITGEGLINEILKSFR